VCQVAPYLYLAINVKQELLVFVIGLGVGVAALLGTLRFVNGWSLKPLIYGSMVPCILLAMYMHWYVFMYTFVCVCVCVGIMHWCVCVCVCVCVCACVLFYLYTIQTVYRYYINATQTVCIFYIYALQTTFENGSPFTTHSQKSALYVHTYKATLYRLLYRMHTPIHAHTRSLCALYVYT
jgi:hypothetical protein